MLRFLIRRIGEMLLLLLLVSGLTFGLFKMIPGDYLSEMELNPSVSKQQLQELREAYGLDEPVYSQYFVWLGQLMRGNLGFSFWQRRSAAALIRERLSNTLVLTASAMFLTLLLGLPAAVVSALRAGDWPDHAFLGLSLLALSLPSILAALLFKYLAYWTDWLPIGGVGGPTHLALPALTLALPLIALLIRTLRAEMLETLRQPFVLAARARGLPRSRVVLHVVRNAANPVITLSGVLLGGLLSGAVVVEKVFDWPGLGALTVDAILRRDLFVAVNCVMAAALAFMIANLLADLLLAWNDPRVRNP